MADDSPREPRRRIMVHGLTPARKATTAAPHAGGGGAVVSAPPFLVGHGYDLHRLQTPAPDGGKLVLAGIPISAELAPIAHSDGDVILHAVVDALLGALGMGDIGQHFSDSDPRWKDAPSEVFVREAMGHVRGVGYRVSNVDITLLLERPKVGPFREQMLDRLRQLLSPVSVVNLKAGTNEGCDAVGRGEAVAAHALVLLVHEPR